MPHARICPTCGKFFEGERRTQKYCSPQCSNARDKRYFVCEVCGKSFYAPKWRWDTARFCSRVCKKIGMKGESRSTKGTIRSERSSIYCLYCGKEITISAWQKGRKKFCSTACSNRYYRKDQPANNRKDPIERNCEICGKKIYSIPSNHDVKYCSKKCFFHAKKLMTGEKSPRWQGGKSYYADIPNWEELAHAARKRDHLRCTKCHISNKASIRIYRKGLEVHHIIPYRISQDNSLDNLKTLCVKCHKWYEHQFYYLL